MDDIKQEKVHVNNIGGIVAIAVPDVDYPGGVDAWMTVEHARELHKKLGYILEEDTKQCIVCGKEWGQP